MSTWDGIYAAYMTGTSGTGFAMLVLTAGEIIGADPLGVRFDGHYRSDDVGNIQCLMNVRVPPNGTTIQGVTAGPDGLAYEVPLNIPANFDQEPFIRVDTPAGAVNLRLEKLRSLAKYEQY